MKIYTKTGDRGQTALFASDRVRKDHVRIATVGEIDELNAVLGVVLAEWSQGEAFPEMGELLLEIQNRLFDLGAELATFMPEEKGTNLLQEGHVLHLEHAIDCYEEKLSPLREFILPGGCIVAAHLHLARCVCRRTERQIVTLADVESVRELPLQYINRLSDLLFVLSRAANQAASVADIPWRKPL